MPKLYSYVVDHDHGFAPCPFGGFCTLAKCKYGSHKRNIVEMADEGDWIAGTGGVKDESAGHGKLIYAMRVDEKIPLADYCQHYNGRRIDAVPVKHMSDRYALLSYHYFYFGRNAIDISKIPRKHLNHRFEKRGPGYRCDFSEEFINDFAKWLENNFKVGVHGPPCDPHSELDMPKCPPRVRRKGHC